MSILKQIGHFLKNKIKSIFVGIFNLIILPFTIPIAAFKKYGFIACLISIFALPVLLPIVMTFKILAAIAEPQIAVSKRIIEKSKKAQISLWIFPLFYLSLGFFTVTHANLAFYATGELPTISTILNLLNGSTDVQNTAYVSDEFLIYFNLISMFADILARSLLFTAAIYLITKNLLDLSMGVVVKSTFWKMVFVLAGFIVANMTHKFEVKGFYYEKSYVEALMDNFFTQKIQDFETLATDEDSKTYDIEAIKVLEPTNFYHHYMNFTNTYLMSAEVGKHKRTDDGLELTMRESDTISIEYLNNVYRVEFAMGGAVTKITASSPNALNQQAVDLKVDLLALEQKFFADFIQSLISNALAIKEKVKDVEVERDLEVQKVGARYHDNQNVTGKRLAFEHDWKTYCHNINDYPLQGDAKLIQKYIQVASLCASQAFLESQYQSDHFDIKEVYAGNYHLSDGYVELFGNQSDGNTWKSVKTLTQSTCKKSYLLCAEAVQKASYINPNSKKELGLLVNATSIIGQVTSSVYDAADDLLDSRTYQESSTGDVSFKDYVVESDKAMFNLKFPLNQKQMTQIIFDEYEFLDLDKLFIPSIQDAFRAALGGDITQPYRRMATCFYYPKQIKNGFKCNSITKELVDLSTANIISAITIKIGNTAISGLSPSSTALQKGATFGKGASNLASAGKATTALGTAIVLPALLNAPTKENQYSTQGTARTILVSSFILKFFNINFTGTLDPLANSMFLTSLSILTILFGLPFLLTVYVLGKITEIIIDIKLFWLKFYTKTMEKGENGIKEIMAEYICEIWFIALLIVYSSNFEYQLDHMLAFKFEKFIETVIVMSSSIDQFIVTFPQFLLMAFYEVMMIVLINSFLIGMFDSISTNLKQSSAQQ
ncbi:hypothetical protein C4G69_RS01260 [Vibrio parahaemolyticus]|nr:hypothetical protein [Vibrio parahaemolyticus]EJG1033935.1 hypothetical protein [Vibrio parahaemolyticus]